MANNDKGFVVRRTQPAIYLDEAGQPVNGYQVSVLLTEFSEGHIIFVPSLDPKEVEKHALALLKQRQALANL